MIKGSEELYKHIQKPIPLQPKKTCENDKARSHQKLE